MKVNKEALTKAVNAIVEDSKSSTSIYYYDNLLDKYNLRSDKDKVRANGLIIRCPFHSEDTPSLSIDYDRHTWFCFGCNRTGNAIDFMVEYDKCVLGRDITFTAKVNQILKEDARIRNKAGVDTVYTRQDKVTEFTPLQPKRFVYRQPTPKTLLELASLMCTKKCSTEQKEYAILLMQSGLSVELIYDEIFNSEAKREKKQYDISEFWEE